MQRTQWAGGNAHFPGHFWLEFSERPVEFALIQCGTGKSKHKSNNEKNNSDLVEFCSFVCLLAFFLWWESGKV